MMKLKLTTIVGARPQFIKAAAISRAIRNIYPDRIEESIMHSGQHYDELLSDVFFTEMEIPQPAYHLNAGSAPHGAQTGEIMSKAEAVLRENTPDMVLVYGDTNTTLAGALAAAKMHIPVIHVEAGLRSRNKSMPEEINRVLTDHVSTLLFTPTETGLENLAREGFGLHAKPPYSADHPGVFHSGDVMFDNTLYFLEKAKTDSGILLQLGLEDREYVLCTLHRPSNTDLHERLQAILGSLHELSLERRLTFVLPMHPRTAKMMAALTGSDFTGRIKENPFLKIVGPVGFLDMLLLESRAKMIITDSGGVQKESYFFHKPCLVLRPETEWTELTGQKTAMLADADPGKIKAGFYHYLDTPPPEAAFTPLFGDGKAAEFILEKITSHFNTYS